MLTNYIPLPTLLLLPLGSIQIFPSILFSNTLDVYNTRRFNGGEDAHFGLVLRRQRCGGKHSSIYCHYDRLSMLLGSAGLHRIVPHNTPISVLTVYE
jgi:hypothetical protein